MRVLLVRLEVRRWWGWWGGREGGKDGAGWCWEDLQDPYKIEDVET